MLRGLIGPARCPHRGADALAHGLELTRPQRAPRRQADDQRGSGGELVLALELASAPGTQRPVEPDEAGAVRTDTVEPGPAGRTDDPGGIDPSIARRTMRDRLDLR